MKGDPALLPNPVCTVATRCVVCVRAATSERIFAFEYEAIEGRVKDTRIWILEGPKIWREIPRVAEASRQHELPQQTNRTEQIGGHGGNVCKQTQVKTRSSRVCLGTMTTSHRHLLWTL